MKMAWVNVIHRFNMDLMQTLSNKQYLISFWCSSNFISIELELFVINFCQVKYIPNLLYNHILTFMICVFSHRRCFWSVIEERSIQGFKAVTSTFQNCVPGQGR